MKLRSNTDASPYNALDRTYHEPNRLAILSALVGSEDGLTFNELKDLCRLTDGNLCRHLRTLEEVGAVRAEKSHHGSRPLTRLHLSEAGREGFVGYLRTLEEVLARAAEAVGGEDRLRPARAMWSGAAKRETAGRTG
jgi:DNA-binding transcriptional ArsR family regulator